MPELVPLRLDGTVCSMAHALGIERDTYRVLPSKEMLLNTLEALVPWLCSSQQ